MLVLTRRLGDSVVIGDDVVVTIIRLGDGQVRLGITAPRAVNVVRGEIANCEPPIKNTDGAS